MILACDSAFDMAFLLMLFIDCSFLGSVMVIAICKTSGRSQISEVGFLVPKLVVIFSGGV